MPFGEFETMKNFSFVRLILLASAWAASRCDLCAETTNSCPPAPANDPFHVHGLPARETETFAEHPRDIFSRDTLLGDVGGWRSAAARHGIEFLPVYVGEVMGNPSGGSKQGTVYDSCLNLPLTVHLDQLVPGWEGATLYGNALWLAGRSLSADYVGDLSNASNISGEDTVRVQELWYEQAFAHGHATVRAGLLDADAEFFTSEAASLFINGTFGAFTLLGANFPNPPIYPMAAPGVRLAIEPTSCFFVQAGVYAGDSGSQEQNRNGLNYHLDSQNGVQIFSETGWRLNQGKDDSGLAGTYKLGSFVATMNFHDQNTGDSAGPNYGVYAVAEQQLCRHEARCVSVFARGGGAPADINAVQWYFDAGFNFTGFIPGRPDDVAGVAVARSWLSSDYSAAQVAAGGGPPYFAETVIEATWRARILPWWTVQPDVQYIFRPGGQEDAANATIIGLRTTVVF
jgi:porin